MGDGDIHFASRFPPRLLEAKLLDNPEAQCHDNIHFASRFPPRLFEARWPATKIWGYTFPRLKKKLELQILWAIKMLRDTWFEPCLELELHITGAWVWNIRARGGGTTTHAGGRGGRERWERGGVGWTGLDETGQDRKTA